MSTDSKNSAVNQEKSLSGEKQQKVDEVRSAVSPVPEKLLRYCSDASIARYLQVRNWNVKKAAKMLKASLKWRSEYKPEEICWEDVSSEAETRTICRPTSVDKKGRPLIVMRPSRQTITVAEQMKYLVYCMENAVLNMPPDQEQMIWLIRFWNFSLSSISFTSAKETAYILQNYYPEMLGLAIMYNPPWLFERFYKMLRPFLEASIRDKVKFVYADDSSSMKIMEELFDMNQFESEFGEKAVESFDMNQYAQRMKADDEKRRSLCTKGNDASASPICNGLTDVSSLSDSSGSSQEGTKQKNGDRSSSVSTAEDSKDSSRDIRMSVSAISLEDSVDEEA